MESSQIIKKYIELKKIHQELFYKYKRLEKENSKLKNKIKKLEVSPSRGSNKTILNENKRLLAKISQLNRISISTPIIKASTPKNIEKSSVEKRLDSTKKKRAIVPKAVFEVDKLIDHRGRKGKREFLVRWKHFDSEDDTWEKEENLSCPKILAKYLKKHRLAH